MDILYFLLFIELIVTLISGQLLLINRSIIHYFNHKYIKSSFLAVVTQMFDWEYYTKEHIGVSKNGDEIKTDITHRKCNITGIEEIEILPRFQGNSRFKRIK